MAIVVRGTSTGANSNAASTTISLPAGVAVGDVSIITFVQATAPGSSATLTPPAGWTTIINAFGVLICWRAFQAGDATTGIAASSSLSTWWISGCITYTGLDTTTPVDARIGNFSYCDSSAQSVVPPQCRAPSLCPNWMGSQLLCVYAYLTVSAVTIALPGGLTARMSSAVGPNLRLCDKLLTDGTPTGTFDATLTAGKSLYCFGAQIALKAAGAAAATLAAARPQVVGSYNQSIGGGSVTLPLAQLNVQNGDMVVATMAILAGNVTATPAGYTQQSAQSGALIFTHLWQTGDSQAPVFTTSGFNGAAVSLVRIVGVSALPITPDQAATATNTGSPAAVSVASQTPGNAAELLLVAFGSTNTTAGAWSGVTAGLTNEVVQSAGPGLRWSWMSPAAVPTGALGATWTTGASVTLGGAALLLSVGAPVGATQAARAMVLA